MKSQSQWWKKLGPLGWQGTLILLPVLALAALGFWALQQDRLAAEQDLRERSRPCVEDSLQRILSAFFPQENGNFRLAGAIFQPPKANQFCNFQVSTNGVARPQPIELNPVACGLDLSSLTAEQSNYWSRLEALSSSDDSGLDPVSKTVEAFEATKPPHRFSVLARYKHAIALLNSGKTNQAINAFENLLPFCEKTLTEAGLPLKQLVQLKLLETGSMDQILKSWDDSLKTSGLMSNGSTTNKPNRNLHPWLQEAIMQKPTLVSSWMAEVADHRNIPQNAGLWIMDGTEHIQTNASHQSLLQHWIARSHAAESAKGFYSFAAGAISPRFFWFGPETNQLGAVLELGTATPNPYFLVFCIPLDSLRDMVKKAISGNQLKPSWIDLAVEISGKTLLETSGAEVLAEAKVTGLPIQVKAVLGNPHAFYARMRQRTLWFGALLILSIVGAGLGLVGAWRAFQKQERLAEMKSNFVSSVSHELRAPIASVRLLAEGLEQGRVNDVSRKQEYFRLIGQECRRLSSLIENVLDFSRIEQGRKQYELESTDLVGLVNTSVQLMAANAAERGISLKTEIDSANKDLLSSQPYVDGKAIQQALVNLMDNALKYSPSGSFVSVGLALKHETVPSQNAFPESPFINLSVTDQGCGIPETEKERIFERFYRVGSELRRETQGVGIGLSIVKHIVEAHGGDIHVDSVVGKGSRFTIRLPFVHDDAKGKERI